MRLARDWSLWATWIAQPQMSCTCVKNVLRLFSEPRNRTRSLDGNWHRFRWNWPNVGLVKLGHYDMTKTAVNSQSNLKSRPGWAHRNSHSHIAMTQLRIHWTVMHQTRNWTPGVPSLFHYFSRSWFASTVLILVYPPSINRDFGFYNILVDDFFIIGVIDFDGVMAALKDVVG